MRSSVLGENTAFHRILGSKSTAAFRKFVDESALGLYVFASKRNPRYERHETQNKMNENTRAFSGKWARSGSVKEVVGFAGGSSN